MKRNLLISTTTALVFAGLMTGPVVAQDAALDTDETKASYSLGMMIGEQLRSFDVDVDFDLLMQGMKTQHGGGETILSLEEAQQTLQVMQQKAMEKQKEEMAKAAAEAGAKSQKFLDENKAREGVTVTESGLQYEVLTPSEGDKPTIDDTVSVHYVGTLIDGTEFDSSIERGEPTTFPLKGVIPGWTEGLQLMTVGSKYRFVIPAELAYGDRGAGKIGPGETLVFEVELLDIEK